MLRFFENSCHTVGRNYVAYTTKKFFEKKSDECMNNESDEANDKENRFSTKNDDSFLLLRDVNINCRLFIPIQTLSALSQIKLYP